MQSRSIVPLPGEIWKDIEWTKGVYQVSSCGRVRKTRDGQARRYCFICPMRNYKGYLRVRMSTDGRKKDRYIHQLVAEAFIGPRPPHLVTNHKDGVKTNNTPENFEYITDLENRIHAYRHRLRLPTTFTKNKQKGATSEYIGVRWHKKMRRWAAQIQFMGHKYHLGSFDSQEDARQAYLRARSTMEKVREGRDRLYMFLPLSFPLTPIRATPIRSPTSRSEFSHPCENKCL